MSSLSICRSTGSVLRSRRPQTILSTTHTCLSASFHATRVSLKKTNQVDPTTIQRKKIIVPPHRPTPKPRRGRKINIPFVHLLDTRTNEPGPVRALEEILDSVNEDEYYVELVSESPPTVKLVDIKEARASTLAERQKAKRGTGQKDMHKEIQLSWSMADADEHHKHSKAREELEKGYRVDLVYSPKKGTRPPPHIEMQFKLKEISAKFDDVAKEWKPPSIERRLGVVHLQSKVKASAKPSREVLKASIPKSVLERKQRSEAATRREGQSSLEE